MSSFDLGIVTPIWRTDYTYLKEMIESVNNLFRTGIPLKWSIVIDGDERDVNVFLRKIIDPLLLQNCSITTLNKRYGPSFARNYGVKSLDCDFICWLDADDAIDIRNFILVINELKSKEKSFWNNYNLIYTDSYECDSYLNVIFIREKKFIHNLHCIYKNTDLDPLLGIDFVYQAQFIKRETFLSVGGFDDKRILGEDVDLILRLSEKSKNINLYHIPVPVYYYRDNPKGRCNLKWEGLKNQMERIYFDSSQRQKLSNYKYRYIGQLCLDGNIFRYIKDNDFLGCNASYDVYLPTDEFGRAMHRPYIKIENVSTGGN